MDLYLCIIFKIPSFGSEDVGIFMHGKQSILLSSALKRSKTINATKAVTCRKKSNSTAKAITKKYTQQVKDRKTLNASKNPT